MRFILGDGALNVDRFTTSLRRPIKDAAQKGFLIVDDLMAHHAGKVEASTANHTREIELYYRPAYAPGLLKSARGVLRAVQRASRPTSGRWPYVMPPIVGHDIGKFVAANWTFQASPAGQAKGGPSA